MPDETGKLTKEEKHKVIAWLDQKAAGRENICPICGGADWFIGDHLVQPLTLGAKQAVMLGGIGYPQIQLVSSPCGHTLYVNAVVVGLLIPHREESAEPKPPVDASSQS